MNLEKHISTLLFHHDCVVVPEFGAFIAQKSNSILEKEKGTFHPPQKEVGFNPSLVKNDGLLIHEVARISNLDFETAKQEVLAKVQFWKNHLNLNSTLNLTDLGNLTKNSEGILTFTPSHPNYLLSSFGLESIRPQQILVAQNQEQSSSAVWWKVAAVIPILVGGFLYFGKPQPVTDFVNQQWSGFVSPMVNPNTIAIKAVESPIKTVEIEADKYIKEELTIQNHQVIGGSFRKMEEANAQVQKLKEAGFEKAQFTQKKGSYFYVAFDTFATEEEAQEFRRSISTDYSEAWILSLKD